MFFHISIHRPKLGKEKLLIESMHRFGEACLSQAGSRGANVLHDQEKGVLIGLAVWDCAEDWQAARPAMLEAVKDDPFDDWEEEPPEVFHLEGV